MLKKILAIFLIVPFTATQMAVASSVLPSNLSAAFQKNVMPEIKARTADETYLAIERALSGRIEKVLGDKYKQEMFLKTEKVPLSDELLERFLSESEELQKLSVLLKELSPKQKEKLLQKIQAKLFFGEKTISKMLFLGTPMSPSDVVRQTLFTGANEMIFAARQQAIGNVANEIQKTFEQAENFKMESWAESTTRNDALGVDVQKIEIHFRYEGNVKKAVLYSILSDRHQQGNQYDDATFQFAAAFPELNDGVDLVYEYNPFGAHSSGLFAKDPWSGDAERPRLVCYYEKIHALIRQNGFFLSTTPLHRYENLFELTYPGAFDFKGSFPLGSIELHGFKTKPAIIPDESLDISLEMQNVLSSLEYFTIAKQGQLREFRPFLVDPNNSSAVAALFKESVEKDFGLKTFADFFRGEKWRQLSTDEKKRQLTRLLGTLPQTLNRMRLVTQDLHGYYYRVSEDRWYSLTNTEISLSKNSKENNTIVAKMQMLQILISKKVYAILAPELQSVFGRVTEQKQFEARISEMLQEIHSIDQLQGLEQGWQASVGPQDIVQFAYSIRLDQPVTLNSEVFRLKISRNDPERPVKSSPWRISIFDDQAILELEKVNPNEALLDQQRREALHLLIEYLNRYSGENPKMFRWEDIEFISQTFFIGLLDNMFSDDWRVAWSASSVLHELNQMLKQMPEERREALNAEVLPMMRGNSFLSFLHQFEQVGKMKISDPQMFPAIQALARVYAAYYYSVGENPFSTPVSSLRGLGEQIVNYSTPDLRPGLLF